MSDKVYIFSILFVFRNMKMTMTMMIMMIMDMKLKIQEKAILKKENQAEINAKLI